VTAVAARAGSTEARIDRATSIRPGAGRTSAVPVPGTPVRASAATASLSPLQPRVRRYCSGSWRDRSRRPDVGRKRWP